MSDRKILCKIKIGSHLYGTSRPDSDLDYSGVFLPSTEDLLGLQSCPGEMSESVKASNGPRNTKGDVDCKFYSLQKFINLAAQGQPGQLELLFAPREMYEQTSPEWEQILAHRDLFLSRGSVWPFVGFALAQAHKTSIKGDNLKALRAIDAWGEGLSPGQKQQRLDFWLEPAGDRWRFKVIPPAKPTRWQRIKALFVRPKPQVELEIFKLTFEIKENDQHFDTFRIAGRQYDPGTKIKVFLGNVRELIKRYGTRSQAAAEDGLDYKSLMHAYRLMGQAEEMLLTGKITLPRPPDEVQFLLGVRNKALPESYDWLGEISARVDRIKNELTKQSNLPQKPRYDKLGELCRDMLRRHIFSEDKPKARTSDK